MFEFRWDRAFRRRASGLFAVVFLIALLADTTSAEAKGEDTSQTISEGVSGPSGLKPGATSGSGPLNCKVRVGTGSVRSDYVGDENGDASVVTVLTNDDGEDGEPAEGAASVVVDSDDADPTDVDYEGIEEQEIVDGKIDLDGVPHNVYSVTGCDGYGEFQQEIVFAPPSSDLYIPALEDALLELLPVPKLELLPFDDEFDWTYVQVAVDFRSDEVSLDTYEYFIDTGGPDTAELEDGGGEIAVRQWMNIVAEPELVIFDSGDESLPEAERRVTCSPEEALAPYDADVPGACSFTFRNASSIAGGTFDVSLSVEWNVTYTSTNGPGEITLAGPTVNVEPTQVAEIKVVNVPSKP